jgi:hypothetical protein
MSFLEIALRNAERGFRIIPLRGKEAFLRNWPQLATTDQNRIRDWAVRFPDYNCGVAGGHEIIILDSDRVSRLKELCGTNWDEWFQTYSVSSGRPDRAHFYFRASPEAVDFGNKKWKEPNIDGHVFELKGKGTQVTAEGSIHPITGAPYVVAQNLPLIPFPLGLLGVLREAYGRANPSGKREWNLPVHDGEGRDDFLIQQAGKLRNAGASEAIIRAHLEELNSDPSIIADPKSDEDLDRLARSAARYDVPAPNPTVVIGSSKPEPQPARPVEHVRPTYPFSAWEGTAVAEFAKLCASDNNIPEKMYAESFRCVLGAVVGDRLCCPGLEGALPRTYTIIIAPKGKGKGTCIRRAVRFFNQDWSGGMSSVSKGLSISMTGGLLSGERDFLWKPKGIGAWMAAASSVPGMAKLCKDLDATIKNKPQLTWGSTLPRVLSVHEEFKTFLSALFIEGGVGSGLEGVVCQLWDDVSFNGTATGTRDALYGEMMFSMLCGVTEQDWFDLLSRGNAVGSGLMSRFNIIGTEGGFENVGKMKQPDFTQLQGTFLPRVMQLEDAHARIAPSEAADSIISEWTDNLPEGSERMNVQAWRSALLIAWLRHEDTISAKTAEDAVALGQYQIASHEYYRTKTADTANARVQARILRALEMKGPMSKRELQRVTHAHRDGTELWNRALDGLLRDRAIGKREDSCFYRAE